MMAVSVAVYAVALAILMPLFGNNGLWAALGLCFAARGLTLLARYPALERGAWVLCDRFVDSTLAYQGYARGIAIETLKHLNDFATDSLVPDLTILLDIETNRGFERVQARNLRGNLPADRIENESRTFHRRIREGYLKLFRAEPERFVRIDSDESEARVAGEIWHAVTGRFQLPSDAESEERHAG
jgi:dTMP kinase